MLADEEAARWERLARAFGALSNPVRLALLHGLRSPKVLTEIGVKTTSPGRIQDGRPQSIARQTVKEHLERLIEADAVVPREGIRDQRPVVEYVTNHQSLFALSEELRELARLRPAVEPEGLTMRRALTEEAGRIQGPCLVLVKGIDEGRRFPLDPPASGKKAWIVGRRRDLDVAIDFDPFVSSENAVVRWEGGGHLIENLPESRNGTTLNFAPLPRGEARPMHHGDIVGVGRTLLVFRT